MSEKTALLDKTFTFIVKSPPAAVLLKQAAGLKSGSAESNKVKVGKVNRKQLEDIVEIKKEDLNSFDIDHAVSMIAGTARSMGLVVED